ncbi:MAG: methyltransferase domain-containing protein [Paracoccaceae bacterium]
MADKQFLKDVYGLKSVADTKALYDEWSDTYDSEVASNGYVTPKRIADALAELINDKSQPILDFGCGTGISGQALKMAGFNVIDGCDLSQAMLDHAANKNTYRRLWQIAPDGEKAIVTGAYGAIAAIGVISIGAAPPETMDGLISALAPGGLFAFSFNDHTLEDPQFEARVAHHLNTGSCSEVLRRSGEHLPGIGLGSTIYILKRL